MNHPTTVAAAVVERQQIRKSAFFRQTMVHDDVEVAVPSPPKRSQANLPRSTIVSQSFTWWGDMVCGTAGRVVRWSGGQVVRWVGCSVGGTRRAPRSRPKASPGRGWYGAWYGGGHVERRGVLGCGGVVRCGVVRWVVRWGAWCVGGGTVSGTMRTRHRGRAAPAVAGTIVPQAGMNSCPRATAVTH